MPSIFERYTVRIVFRYVYMGQIVADAIEILRDRSPVGSERDAHPGLYRDSHMVFLNGSVVPGGDVSAWQPGDQINISNPVPYARKIELGSMRISVPPRVYEDAVQVLAGRYGNQASIRFTFMPVRFGDNAAYAAFSQRERPGRKLSAKARADWLARQPAIEIRGLQ